MEDITDADYRHTQNVWENFGKKTEGKYHNLYVQNNTVLLASVFENFLNMSHMVLTAPGLALQAALKKKEKKNYYLTPICSQW